MSHLRTSILDGLRWGALDSADVPKAVAHVIRCSKCSRRAEPGNPIEQMRPNEPFVAHGCSEQEEENSSRSRTSEMASPRSVDLETEYESDSNPLHAHSEIPPSLLVHPRYDLIEKLGEGGMGTVLLAKHRLMNRRVAIKTIRSLHPFDEGLSERFLNEIRAAAGLNHPNIVAALDAETADESYILVMEFVEGLTLERKVQSHGPLSVCMAAHFACSIAHGLRYANCRGIVHRDVKPANVMISKTGQLKLLDFGLASFRSASSGRGPTLQGQLLGTPEYMAPEQAIDSSTVDHRADIYGLGGCLFFMLSGEKPFAYESVVEVLAAQIKEPARSVRQLRPDVPIRLAEFLERMLAKSPGERPQSYDEVIAALAPFAKAKQNGTSQSRHRENRRHMHIDRPSRTKRILLCAFPILAALLMFGLGNRLSATANVPRLPLANDPPLPELNNGTPRTLVVVPFNNYWGPDFDTVIEGLRKEGIDYDIASSQPGVASPNPESTAIHTARVDMVVSGENDMNSNWDMVVFIGAYPIVDLEYAREHRNIARELTLSTIAGGGVVGAMHGAADVFVETGVLTNKRIAHVKYLMSSTYRNTTLHWDKHQIIVPADSSRTILTTASSEVGADLVHAMYSRWRSLNRVE